MEINRLRKKIMVVGQTFFQMILTIHILSELTKINAGKENEYRISQYHID